MVRGRVKIAFIENNADRKASYTKRMKGFTKKLNELTTLCGVEAGAIVYSPYQDKPEIWPKNPNAVDEVIKKFNEMPDSMRTPKMMNQEELMSQMIEKKKMEINQLKQHNRENEVFGLFRGILEGSTQLCNLSIQDLGDLDSVVTKKFEEVKKRMENLGKKDEVEPANGSSPIPDLNL